MLSFFIDAFFSIISPILLAPLVPISQSIIKSAHNDDRNVRCTVNPSYQTPDSWKQYMKNNKDETHLQAVTPSVKCSSPLLLQFEWLLHLQSHYLHSNRQTITTQTSYTLSDHFLSLPDHPIHISDGNRRIMIIQWIQ